MSAWSHSAGLLQPLCSLSSLSLCLSRFLSVSHCFYPPPWVRDQTVAAVVMHRTARFHVKGRARSITTRPVNVGDARARPFQLKLWCSSAIEPCATPKWPFKPPKRYQNPTETLYESSKAIVTPFKPEQQHYKSLVKPSHTQTLNPKSQP